MEIQNETILDHKQMFDVAIKQKNMQIFRYVGIALLLFSISALIYYFIVAKQIGSILLIFFILSAIMLFPKKIKLALKKRMEGQPANYKYTFRDDEIEIDLISLMVKESRSTISYQMIDRIEFHQNYFIIYLPSHNLFIVDRNGFPTEADKNSVESFLKQKVKKIKGE